MRQKQYGPIAKAFQAPFDWISSKYLGRIEAKRKKREAEKLHSELEKALKNNDKVRMWEIKQRLHQLTGEYIP